MEDNPEDYTLLGIMSFYRKWCLDSDAPPEPKSDDDDSYEQRIRDFLALLHKGIEMQEIAVYGGDIKDIRKYIEIVERAQRYEWSVVGNGEPQYRKIGAHNFPALLRLQMFELEEIEVDPVKLRDWMMERADRREFLAPSARPPATPSPEQCQQPVKSRERILKALANMGCQIGGSTFDKYRKTDGFPVDKIPGTNDLICRDMNKLVERINQLQAAGKITRSKNLPKNK